MSRWPNSRPVCGGNSRARSNTTKAGCAIRSIPAPCRPSTLAWARWRRRGQRRYGSTKPFRGIKLPDWLQLYTAWMDAFQAAMGSPLTTLYNFCSQSECTDGSGPLAGLVQAANGNLYGTPESGGLNCAPYGCGTGFKVTQSGTLTTLYSFCAQSGCADGEYPDAGLVRATNGTFYATTELGGVNNGGTVFSLSVGLAPFVETLPTSGEVGAAVKILGNKLTGSTSVSFNGTAAAFTVVSASEITTNVPVGATTGRVQV